MRPKERHIVSAPAKWEYLQAVDPRYRQARRPEKRWILDEVCRIQNELVLVRGFAKAARRSGLSGSCQRT
jgi:nitroreductase